MSNPNQGAAAVVLRPELQAIRSKAEMLATTCLRAGAAATEAADTGKSTRLDAYVGIALTAQGLSKADFDLSVKAGLDAVVDGENDPDAKKVASSLRAKLMACAGEKARFVIPIYAKALAVAYAEKVVSGKREVPSENAALLMAVWPRLLNALDALAVEADRKDGRVFATMPEIYQYCRAEIARKLSEPKEIAKRIANLTRPLVEYVASVPCLQHATSLRDSLKHLDAYGEVRTIADLIARMKPIAPPTPAPSTDPTVAALQAQLASLQAMMASMVPAAPVAPVAAPVAPTVDAETMARMLAALQSPPTTMAVAMAGAKPAKPRTRREQTKPATARADAVDATELLG